jgi:hypothetical protein
MDLKDIKARVSEIFNKYNVQFEEETPATEEVAMAEAELADGTKVFTDAEAWAERVNIYIINDEDEKIAVPTGEYELADGRTVIVTDGMVDSISEGDPVEEEKEVEVEAEAETMTKEDVLNVIEAAVGALREEFKSHIEAKDKEIEKLKTEFSHKGLPRAVEPKPAMKREDFAKLSPKERVAALYNKFN